MEILIEHADVQREYQRWCSHFGPDDPYATSDTVGLRDVLRAHFLIADYFYVEGYGMGGLGPRDAGLLHSAVYRQFVSYDGKDKWNSMFERCATLVFGLVKDHPFHDANKRTALLVLLYFLTKTKRTPTAGQKEIEELVLKIAENRLWRHRRLQGLRERTDDPEIAFLSDFIRRNSRPVDRCHHAITYHELDARLREHGFCLTSQSKGFVDVCQIEERRGFLGIGKRQTRMNRKTQIVFRGWKQQVPKETVAAVRKATSLVPEKGVDSASFFHGLDPMNALIAEYAGPLERLAYR